MIVFGSPPQDPIFDVLAELKRQHEKWGVQDHENGTSTSNKVLADAARAACNNAHQEGYLTWKHILNEEVLEAFAEEDPQRLREELIQVAAVALQWAAAIDRRR